MTITVRCVCGQRYEVRPSLAGKKFRCKKCTDILTIPVTTPSSTADDIDLDFNLSEYSDAPSNSYRLVDAVETTGNNSLRKSAVRSMSFLDEPSLDERIAARSAEFAENERRCWKRPLKFIAIGVMCTLLTIWMAYDIIKAPFHGGFNRYGWVVSVSYLLGGKWGVVVLSGIIAACNFLFAILYRHGIVLDDDE
ncbi:MAG: hypothetical protein O2955_11490 [Planctomycetota bacterium]|nr:hypothetical protein [Planctomycetota bacterium]MDA1213137.1 hypothetical protein [Planctomycetota bacterium]